MDERGYPVPYFVAWINGKPDFRIANEYALRNCIRSHFCWTCGEQIGSYKAFVIGPMCALNRTSAEPPSHLDCAEWSVKGCPFLSNANMKRREDDFTESIGDNVAGIMIKRNPGVMCIWVTRSYKLFPDVHNKVLFEIGQPESISWWREGRPATREEIMESIRTGLPFLEEQVERENEKDRPAAREALKEAYARAMNLLPAV